MNSLGEFLSSYVKPTVLNGVASAMVFWDILYFLNQQLLAILDKHYKNINIINCHVIIIIAIMIMVIIKIIILVASK